MPLISMERAQTMCICVCVCVSTFVCLCVFVCICASVGMIHMNDYRFKTWTMMEKSLAILGDTPSAKVMTGNATAPPPSLVIPVWGTYMLTYVVLYNY